jgi:hypothetical protein
MGSAGAQLRPLRSATMTPIARILMTAQTHMNVLLRVPCVGARIVNQYEACP